MHLPESLVRFFADCVQLSMDTYVCVYLNISAFLAFIFQSLQKQKLRSQVGQGLHAATLNLYLYLITSWRLTFVPATSGKQQHKQTNNKTVEDDCGLCVTISRRRIYPFVFWQRRVLASLCE